MELSDASLPPAAGTDVWWPPGFSRKAATLPAPSSWCCCSIGCEGDRWAQQGKAATSPAPICWGCDTLWSQDGSDWGRSLYS